MTSGEVAQHQVFGFHGGVGFQFTPPVPFRILRAAEIVLGPPDRFVRCLIHISMFQLGHHCYVA